MATLYRKYGGRRLLTNNARHGWQLSLSVHTTVALHVPL
jgi:hypothetical protein